MFDIAFSELVLVFIVAAALFSPKDILITAKNASYYIKQIKRWWVEYSSYLYEELDLYNQKDIARYIKDKDGVIREAYDLSIIKPNIISTTQDEKSTD